jgi:hypothetical protein
MVAQGGIEAMYVSVPIDRAVFVPRDLPHTVRDRSMLRAALGDVVCPVVGLGALSNLFEEASGHVRIASNALWVALPGDHRRTCLSCSGPSDQHHTQNM